MAGSDFTTLEALMKTYYLDRIDKQINQDATIYQNFRKSTLTWDGNELKWPAKLGSNQGIGATAEHKALPTPGSPKVKQFVITSKTLFAVFSISQKLINATKSEQGSFARGKAFSFADTMDAFVKDMNRQFIGDGSGVLATVQGAVADSTTVNVEYAGTADTPAAGNPIVAAPGTRYLNEGMVVAIGTAAELAAGAAVLATINTVNDQDTFTTTAAVTLVDGDLIVRAKALDNHSYNAEITGLLKHISDDTGTYQGLSRLTYRKIRGNVFRNGGVLRDIDDNLLLMAYDRPREEVGGEIDYVVGHTSIRQKLAMTMLGDRRYGNDLRGGISGDLTYNNVKIDWDVDATFNSLFLIDSRWFEVAEKYKGWLAEDGRTIRLSASGAADWEAIYNWEGEFVCRKPRANSLASDLNATITSGN